MTIAHVAAVKNISIVMEGHRLIHILIGLLGFLWDLPTTTGQVLIEHENAQIEEVITRYKTLNKSQKTLKGWTIQILSTRDRREMETEMSIFRQRFPELSVRQVYNEPYYTLKVGSFVSKMEALGLRGYLQRYYNYAILSQENVRKEDYN